MITPNDIETKVFSSSLRGYNRQEVDEFLDQIMIDYQALLDQNAKMLERVHVLQKQVAEAKDPAKMTQDAKRLMNDISASAEQKAEVIIKNAKHDAENIVRNAKDSTSQADEDAERLRRKVEKFKLRFKEMLEEEIDRVDDNSEDLLDDLRSDFYPTMLYGDKDADMTKVAGGAVAEEDPIAELPDVEPTGDIVPEETEEAGEGLDQNPDAEEAGALEEAEEDIDQNPDIEESENGVSDETIVIEKASVEEAAAEAEDAEETEEAAEQEESEDAAEPEESDEAEGPETDEAAELASEAAEEPASEAAEEPESEAEAEGAAEEEAEEADDSVGSKWAPAETIVIDRAALAKAQTEYEEKSGEPETQDKAVESMTDETLIIDKAEMAAATEEFQDYDDPDRPEPAPEPEPVVEMKESDFADYAEDADSTVDITDDLKKN